MTTAAADLERNITRLNSVTERLISSSEKRSMSTLNDHPWEIPVGEAPILRKTERLSIYATEYWDRTTDEERLRLSQEEMASWWSAFIHLESLVVEYYMKELNGGAFDDLPIVRDYMKHFVKEEIVHTLVFGKALDYFGIEVYPMPDFLHSFYDDNAGTGKYPLMAVYLTMIIEWIADEYQRLDADAEYVHPMAKAVVQAHWREEMRHIKWGQQMIKSLVDTDDEFKEHARQLTPVYVRQLIDQGVTNVDCFDRIEFADPVFKDREALLDTVINSEHRRQLNEEMMKPLIHYFVTSGIYDQKYREIWEMNGFGHLIPAA